MHSIRQAAHISVVTLSNSLPLNVHVLNISDISDSIPSLSAGSARCNNRKLYPEALQCMFYSKGIQVSRNCSEQTDVGVANNTGITTTIIIASQFKAIAIVRAFKRRGGTIGTQSHYYFRKLMTIYRNRHTSLERRSFHSIVMQSQMSEKPQSSTNNFSKWCRVFPSFISF